jgi:pimeloyl-ACP methyl ester carboxylesterase
MDLRHAYADVNGIRLHYVAAGEGELMLFLHGFPEFWYAWRNQLEEFGRDHLGVAPDMRGYNLSSKPPEVEQYQMSALVEDVRALADHLGAQQFTLVGHDWGGVVAWAFAITHPERLRRLIIVNAPHPVLFQRELRQNPAQQQASRYMLRLRSPQAEELLAADGYAMLARGLFPMSDEERAAYVEAWSHPGALRGGVNYYRAARTGPADENDILPQSSQRTQRDGEQSALAPASSAMNLSASIVRVPTLVIWGEQDPFLLTSNLDGLDQYVPDLTIEGIPDGSHWVIHEQPERVNTVIREFIAGADTPDGVEQGS